MLGKLLKYEIPALGRKLVPLYIGWAVTAVLLGLAIGPFEEKSEFMVVLSALLYTAAATAVLVMAVIMIIQRYNNSLLGDGGYFSHVLPVSATQHIASKTLAAMIWVLLSGVAMLVTGIIIALFSGHITDIFSWDWAEILKAIANVKGVFWISVIEFIVLFVISITKSILAIYAAITIGHQAKQHTTLASIGAYFGVMTFESIIGRIAVAALGFRYDIFASDVDFNITMLICIIISIGIGAVYFFICKSLMETKLNLS